MSQPKIPRIGINLSDTVYIPLVKSYVPAKAFKTSIYSCVVYTDCECFDPDLYEYLYIMFVYRQHDNGRPCFAVASSSHSLVKLSNDTRNTLGTYTLGVFPCDGKMRHLNLGLSPDWVDLEKFTAKAMSIFHERLSPSEVAQEIPLSEDARRRMQFISEHDLLPKRPKTPWWKFW